MSVAAPTVNNDLSRAYLQPLLDGDRAACRSIVDQASDSGISCYDLLTQLIWPTMELLQNLYREDRITVTQLNLATRLNRSLTDQICSKLPRGEARGRKVLIFCGNDEPEELG